jgi:hypothetical protein
MNRNNPQQENSQAPFWHKLEKGQALVEYWPTIPVAIAVMVVASALLPILDRAFTRTADGLTGITCDAPVSEGSNRVDLDGGHSIVVSSSVYDPVDDRTTVSFTVASGTQPSISHWVLGIDQATANRIIQSSEAYEPWGLDPTTGKYGIKFDIGYEGGDAGGPPGDKGGGRPRASVDNGGLVLASFRSSSMDTLALTSSGSGEVRTIVLTFSGQIDIETVEVTTKAGASQVSSGTVTIPSTSSSGSEEDC